MNIKKLFEPDPFGVSLDFTEEFLDDALDHNKKTQPHNDRCYPTPQKNRIIENEQT